MEGSALIDTSLVSENDVFPESDTIYFISDETSGKVTLLSEAEYDEFLQKLEG